MSTRMTHCYTSKKGIYKSMLNFRPSMDPLSITVCCNPIAVLPGGGLPWPLFNRKPPRRWFQYVPMSQAIDSTNSYWMIGNIPGCQMVPGGNSGPPTPATAGDEALQPEQQATTQREVGKKYDVIRCLNILNIDL